MMNNVFSNQIAWGWHIHIIFGGALFVGAILLIIWAAKFMSKKALQNWTIWLIVIGVIGVLLTAGLGFNGWKEMMRWHKNWELDSVNWESMAKEIKEADFKDLDTREEWREYMLDEMEEHMGLDD